METEGHIEGDSMLQKTIDSRRARFPCCIVWTPLPFISWFIPFIGHVGLCREDGVILDFAGPYYVSVDSFSFGAVARYLQLDRSKITQSEEGGSAWDDALKKSTGEFQHRSYNLFTCNCHSFVVNSLNRMRYGGRDDWNLVKLAAWIYLRGRWVDKKGLLRSLLPFFVLLFVGFLLGGSTFLVFWLLLSLALTGWFLFATYCCKNLVKL